MEPGALVGVAAAALAVVALVAVLLLARSARARRDALAAQLARSHADVEALGRRVADLADELKETRRVAAADHEYVITSLGDPVPEEPSVMDALVLPRRRIAAGRLVEDRLIGSLRRSETGTPTLATEVVVRTVALAHGVRRALSPDNVDRAAAEAHVARRRSRRTRRKELRDARRLLRSVKAQDVA